MMSESGGGSGWGWGALVFFQSHVQELALHSLLGQKQVVAFSYTWVRLSPADIKVKGNHLLLRSLSVCTMLCTNSENNALILSVLRLAYKVASFVMASSYVCVIVFCFLSFHSPTPFKAFFPFQLIPFSPHLSHPVTLPFYVLITCIPAHVLFHTFLKTSSFPLMLLFRVL